MDFKHLQFDYCDPAGKHLTTVPINKSIDSVLGFPALFYYLMALLLIDLLQFYIFKNSHQLHHVILSCYIVIYSFI